MTSNIWRYVVIPGCEAATDSNKAQEMEQERLAREKEEEEKAEKAKKVKEQFGDTSGQWEKDKSDMQNLATEQTLERKEKGKAETREMKEQDGGGFAKKLET